MRPNDANRLAPPGYGVAMTDVLQPFGEGIWLVDGDLLRMFGIPFTTRMTVAKLADGLWLHSPVVASEARVAAIAELGEIAHVVAPGTFHHLYVDPWKTHAAAGAQVWAAPGLPARYPKRDFDAELSDEAPPAWAGEIDQVVFRGSRVMNEVVFFHRRSRTVIFTDIIQNHDPACDGLFWRTIKRWNRISAPDGGVPFDWRLTVRDRDAARRSRDALLKWPFEQVVMTHGVCITENAHTHVERAFAWLDK